MSIDVHVEKFCVERVWDDGIEVRAEVDEEDACICFRIVNVLEKRVHEK